MLSGGTSDAHTSLDNPVDFTVSLPHAAFFVIVSDISECRFVSQCSNGSGPVSLAIPENHFTVGMSLALVLSGEIQVNIRFFISLKSQKCFKRNIEPFFHQRFIAYRAVFVRHVAAGPSGIGICSDFL